MRRPIRVTYEKLSAALGNPEELPIRKQFCLQFIKWGHTTRKEDKVKFVELAKLWRKEEGRVGSHRTLLERKARKLFREAARHKKLASARKGAKKFGEEQVKKQRGIHSPEMKAKHLEICHLGLKVRREKDIHGAMDWIIHNEETGETQQIKSLRRFCRENDLHMWDMWKAVKNGTYYKGWKAERYSSEWENL